MEHRRKWQGASHLLQPKWFGEAQGSATKGWPPHTRSMADGPIRYDNSLHTELAARRMLNPVTTSVKQNPSEARVVNETPSPSPPPVVTPFEGIERWARDRDDPFLPMSQKPSTPPQVRGLRPYLMTSVTPSGPIAKRNMHAVRQKATGWYRGSEESQRKDTGSFSAVEALRDRGDDLTDYIAASRTAMNVNATSSASPGINTPFHSSTPDTPVVKSTSRIFSLPVESLKNSSAGQTVKRPGASDTRHTVRQIFDGQVGRNEAKSLYERDRDNTLAHQQSGSEYHDSTAHLTQAQAELIQLERRGQIRQMQQEINSSSTAKSPNDASLSWITAAKPSDFKSKSSMQVVRQTAMASYLKLTENHAGEQLGSSTHQAAIGRESQRSAVAQPQEKATLSGEDEYSQTRPGFRSLRLKMNYTISEDHTMNSHKRRKAQFISLGQSTNPATKASDPPVHVDSSTTSFPNYPLYSTSIGYMDIKHTPFAGSLLEAAKFQHRGERNHRIDKTTEKKKDFAIPVASVTSPLPPSNRRQYVSAKNTSASNSKLGSHTGGRMTRSSERRHLRQRRPAEYIIEVREPTARDIREYRSTGYYR